MTGSSVAIKLVVSLCAGLSCRACLAAVRLADPFADGVVLQRDRPVRVWGTADPGSHVTVTFADARAEAVADGRGKWQCALPVLALSDVSRDLRAEERDPNGKVLSALAVRDVLVGDVWFVSGQSNMEFPLCGGNPHYSERNGAALASIVRMPLVRFCQQSVCRVSAVPKDKAAKPVVWQRFEPANLMRGEAFSAVGAYFAIYVHMATRVPLGLVGAYWGGSFIDAWTPREGTMTRPDLRDILAFAPSDTWDGKTPRPVLRSNRLQDQPAVLWNEMVNPWRLFEIRGLVWYQGCADKKEPERYASKMHALYNGWRERFGNPDLRLYYVQLAPTDFGGIAKMQEAQARFEREQPKAGMAVINDLGNPYDIHPTDKGTVGLRLARMALKRDYGFVEIEDRSPTLKSWKVEDDAFVLDFDHAKRLYIYNKDLSTVSPFEIAGADGVFRPARIANMHLTRRPDKHEEYRGQIDGGARLVVRAQGVAKPVRLRYCHSAPYLGTVYNEANLPLGAFHVDKEGK